MRTITHDPASKNRADARLRWAPANRVKCPCGDVRPLGTQTLGGRSFRSRRSGIRGSVVAGRSAASGLRSGTTAARLAAATLVAETAEQLELASTAAATAAGLFGRAATALFNDRATTARLRSGTGRLFDGCTSTRRLHDCRAAARRLSSARCLATTTTSLAAIEEASIGLAFHCNHSNHHRRQSQGSTKQKFPTHRNSSNYRNKSQVRSQTRLHGRLGKPPDQHHRSDGCCGHLRKSLYVSRRSLRPRRIASPSIVKIYRLNNLRCIRGLGGPT